MKERLKRTGWKPCIRYILLCLNRTILPSSGIISQVYTIPADEAGCSTWDV